MFIHVLVSLIVHRKKSKHMFLSQPFNYTLTHITLFVRFITFFSFNLITHFRVIPFHILINFCLPHVSFCIFLYPPVSSCIPLYPPVSSCIFLYPPVFSCIPVSSCILLYPPVSSCILLYLPVSYCIPRSILYPGQIKGLQVGLYIVQTMIQEQVVKEGSLQSLKLLK